MDEDELEQKIDALIAESGLTDEQVCGVLEVMMYRYKESAAAQSAT